MTQCDLGALGTMMIRGMDAEVELPSQLLSFIPSDSYYSAAGAGRGGGATAKKEGGSAADAGE